MQNEIIIAKPVISISEKTQALKLRKIELEVAKAEIELKKAKNEVVDIKLAEAFAIVIIQKTKQELKNGTKRMSLDIIKKLKLDTKQTELAQSIFAFGLEKILSKSVISNKEKMIKEASAIFKE